MKKYKLVPFDEVHNLWLLKEKKWWIFYSFVSAGTKEHLTNFVKEKNGVLENE